jgi:hypothetical protein
MKLEDLRRLCAEHWNPIGVPMADLSATDTTGFRPLPADEYDVYLLHALAMVEGGSSKSEIVAYLNTVEQEYLMLSQPAGDKGRFVDALFEKH